MKMFQPDKEPLQKKMQLTIQLSGEKLEAFLLRSETRQGCLLSTVSLVFNIMLEVPATSIKQEKERKGILIRKGTKLSFFANDIMV